MRIAICGGTFDPFHRGHLEPVRAVRDQLQWDRVIYVPARRQPFKAAHETASGYHRFAMTALGTEDLQGSSVWPGELEREGFSYTVDTLESLRGENPGAIFDVIIGDDNVPRLGEWKALDRIFELANFVVLSRSGAGLPPQFRAREVSGSAPRTAGTILIARNETVPVSSTEIRNRLRTGLPIDAFVDPRVARYIQSNALYQSTTKGSM